MGAPRRSQPVGEKPSRKRRGGAPKGNQFASGKRSRPEPGAPSFVLSERRPPATTHGGTTVLREVPELSIHAVDPASATRPLRELTAHALPPGSPVSEVRRAMLDDLLVSLGGEQDVSVQERWLAEAATDTYLQLRYVDTWLAQRASLFVSEARGVPLPILLHRQTIARSLAKLVAVLGTARRTKSVDDLQSYLARKAEGAGT